MCIHQPVKANNFEEFGPLQTKITSPKHQTYKLTGAFFVVKEYRSEQSSQQPSRFFFRCLNIFKVFLCNNQTVKLKIVVYAIQIRFCGPGPHLRWCISHFCFFKIILSSRDWNFPTLNDTFCLFNLDHEIIHLSIVMQPISKNLFIVLSFHSKCCTLLMEFSKDFANELSL